MGAKMNEGPRDKALAPLAQRSEVSRRELSDINSKLESATPSEVLEWANDRFGGSIVLACSFENLVLLDIAIALNSKMPVVFIDTGAHFQETLEFVETAKEIYGLDLKVTTPGAEADHHRCGSKRCCELRKVIPLRGVLSNYRAWVTALKRVDSPTRSDIAVVSYDEVFDLVKINPLATWTDDDVDSYISDHGLMRHPLYDKGYLSIGCEPTTRPVVPGEDPRSGRWSGTTKTECGIHVARGVDQVSSQSGC